MSGYWSRVADTTNGYYTEGDFESAAYRLIMDQALYHSDRGSKAAYSLIERYEKEFSKVLEPFGIELIVDRIHTYIVALPKHNKLSPASKSETLFALVLRGIYEESLREANHYLNESGEVFCNLHDLEEKYRLMVGEELPTGKGLFETLMRAAQRWGIARWINEHEYPTEADLINNGIAIRPAIVDVLGETALRKLALWKENEGDSGGFIDEPENIETLEIDEVDSND